VSLWDSFYQFCGPFSSFCSFGVPQESFEFSLPVLDSVQYLVKELKIQKRFGFQAKLFRKIYGSMWT
jgi:hypothetical protein